MQTIRVETPSAKYDVLTGSGLVRTLAPRIERIAGRLPRRVFVLTSPEIWALWSDTFLGSFAEPPVALFLPAGEKHKTMASVEQLARQMTEAGGDRGSLLIAFGGGIVGEGELLLGNSFGAGEVGHHQIKADSGFNCTCGKIGCFEVQASGTGLIRHAFALEASFPRSSLLDSARDALSSKRIRKAAQTGDPHALAAWRNYTSDLSIGLANIIAFVNPEIVALGGGVSSAGAFMLDTVRPEVDRLTTMVPKGVTRIEIATMGNDAGQVGAAVMALRGGLTTHATITQ